MSDEKKLADALDALRTLYIATLSIVVALKSVGLADIEDEDFPKEWTLALEKARAILQE